MFCQGCTRYVDQCNVAGLAPLHLAVLAGCGATVRALIRGGAAPDIPMRGAAVHSSDYGSAWLCPGSTPLHLACGRGLIGIGMALLEASAAAPGATGALRVTSEKCRVGVCRYSLPN